MKTLELKHIVPYLLYKIDILIKRLKYPVSEYIEKLSLSNIGVIENKLYNVKLVLRPLSDLTKEIEIDGEKFVPIDKILDTHSFISDIHISKFRKFKIIQEQIHILKDIKELGYKYCDYWFLQYLFEWHFDISGLIEQGLAVDINTINK